MKEVSLQALLQRYFYNFLVSQRGCSQHTVASYRDTWRLFLRSTAARRRCDVSRLQASDMTSENVLAFLDELEQVRGATIGTRNCRLAAIKSFSKFVVGREPSMAEQFLLILQVPTKRGGKREMAFLEADEIEAILSQPARSTLLGRRDYALLAMLYNTGARIQEALDVTPNDLRLSAPYEVKLHGKGRKERTCHLWRQTAGILSAFLKETVPATDSRIFLNRYGQPLKAAGVRYKLKRYVQRATLRVPSIGRKRVSPHTFRHSAGVEMIARGIDITVIRDIFGHVSLDTTSQYARANPQTKREALERVGAGTRPTLASRWKTDGDLIRWLDSL